MLLSRRVGSGIWQAPTYVAGRYTSYTILLYEKSFVHDARAYRAVLPGTPGTPGMHAGYDWPELRTGPVPPSIFQPGPSP